MEAKRTLLWLSATSNRSPHNPLDHDWDILPLQLKQPPAPVTTGQDVRIGVVDLSNPSTVTHPNLEQWLDLLGPVSWVALISGQPQDNDPVSHFIGTYCADYHTLPLDSFRLNTILGHLWGMGDLQTRISRSPATQIEQQALTGKSATIRHARGLLRRFARTTEPVLIYGHSGTGKETAARFVHEHSPVNHGPLVTINCAALPLSLTQSELFGYEKGAFTSAIEARSGRIEAAHGGSLILMGIDELLPEQQSALLRFLQGGTVERIGGRRARVIRTRVIATSSQPLQDLVANNRFRSDIYYRLGGLRVELPELYKRIEDIPQLAHEHLKGISPELGRYLTDDAMRCLLTHSWPGNLRELGNRLRQAAVLSSAPALSPFDLGFTPAHDSINMSLAQYRARAEKQALSSTLTLTNNNVTAAARLLKISRVSLYRLMKKHHTTHRPPGRSLS